MVAGVNNEEITKYYLSLVGITSVDLERESVRNMRNMRISYMFKFKPVAICPLCHLKVKVMMNVEHMKSLILY